MVIELGYDILSINVAGKEIREKRKILIYGSCVEVEYPHFYEKYSQGRVPLKVCLEKDHMNMVGFKVASIIARVNLDEIIILTVDGSPHCVQLHMMVEEVEKITGKKGKLNVRHIVIENGKDIEVNPTCIKVARYLTKIQRLMEKEVNDNTSV